MENAVIFMFQILLFSVLVAAFVSFWIFCIWLLLKFIEEYKEGKL